MQNLKGKKIKFLEDVTYGRLSEFNPNIKQPSLAAGLEFKGELNDGMNQEQFDELASHLQSIGFIKDGDIVIPAGTIVEITFDNMGNDVDMQIDEKLNINIINGFVFDGISTGNEEEFLAEIV